MGKRGVKVLVRTRPTAVFSQDQIVIDQAKKTVQVNRTGAGERKHGEMDNQKSSWNFMYDQVLHNASQEETYGESALEVVSSVMEGSNGTIMAYGQTGSGKTFTMSGDAQNFKQRGITPRAIAQIFAEIEERPQQEFSVHASYMEIYNERIFDLLDDSGENKDFQIVEDARTKSMQVRGLTMEPVQDETEALAILFRGDQNRTVAEHQLNKASNRSHAIFTLHIEQKSRIRPDEVLRSKLNLVDLAGSERLKKSLGETVDPSLQKESTYINKSLTYLEQVVVALTGKAKQYVPYRQTKLTNVLKDSLGGNCCTVLIACISGEAKNLEETISTLKLAQRMMKVENNVTTNQQVNAELMLKKYERQIRELKQELMMQDALANRTGVSYEELSPEECQAIAVQCERFVQAGPEDEEEAAIKIESVRQIQQCFKQFKLMIQRSQAQAQEGLQRQLSAQSSGSRSPLPGGADNITAQDNGGALVGDAEGFGFSLGEAPAGAKPAKIERPGNASPTSQAGRDGYFSDEEKQASSPKYTGAGGDFDADSNQEESQGREFPTLDDQVPKDRDRAFRVFTAHGEGASLHREMLDAARKVKSFSPQLQKLRQDMKAIQAEIEENQRKLGEIRAESKCDEGKRGPDGEEIIDEEEFLLLRDIKDAKKNFRQAREAYDKIKLQKDEQVDLKDTAQARLLEKFQAWFDEASRLREEKCAEEDVLDDGEQFDKLELERVQAADPDSVAFFKAQKAQKERLRRGHRPSPQSKRT